MGNGWAEAASRAKFLFHQLVETVQRPHSCTHDEWLNRFMDRFSTLAPQIPEESVTAIAAYWAPQATFLRPEEAAESAVIWIESGGIGS